MQYAVLIYNDEKFNAARDDREIRENGERHARLMTVLRERSALVGGERLQDSATATTLRRDGERVAVTDGPYAETAEQLGGFYLVDAADLDEVIGWARQLTEAAIEIRPILPMRSPQG
ncbi:MAG TPA: YciI family protein [Actinoplanes sp.]|jgi:hypothetical protein